MKLENMKDFCVQITDSNKQVMKDWFKSIKKTDYCWSTHAHYGVQDHQLEGHLNHWITPITIEEFQKLIAEPTEPVVINEYEIY